MNITNENIVPASITFGELLNGLSEDRNYEHLKIILSRSGKCSIEEKFLMVTRSGNYGIVNLLDVDFVDDTIVMLIKDAFSNDQKIFRIDINDLSFRFFLIKWQDIRNMVYSEHEQHITDDDELLELEN